MRLRWLVLSLLGVASLSAPIKMAAQAQVRVPIEDTGATIYTTEAERPLALADLVHHAGTIFAGTVTRIESGQHDGVATPGVVWISFRVSQWVRGAQPAPTYTLREWAGLWVGAPRYRVGQSLVLFLHPESALGFSSPVGGSAGILPIADDRTVALTPALAPAIRAKRLNRDSPNLPTVTVKEFLRSIQEQVAVDSR